MKRTLNTLLVLPPALCTLFLLLATLGYAQAPSNYGTQGVAPSVAEVSTDTMNIHLDIPVVNKTGVGIPFNMNLSFNNNQLYVDFFNARWQRTSNGWQMPNYGIGSYQINPDADCTGTGAKPKLISSFTDSEGTVHQIPGAQFTDFYAGGGVHAGCSSVNGGTYPSVDGSGLTFTIDMTNGSYVTTKDGTVIHPGFPTTSIIDTNGNAIVGSGIGTSAAVITDTVGVAEVSYNSVDICFGTTPTVFGYPTSTGTASVSVYCIAYTLGSNFGYSASEMIQSTAYFVDHIVTADGSQYQFTYESQVAGTTTGRLATVTYPNGSVTTYAYTGANFGTDNTTGMVHSMTRTTAEGTWTFSRTGNTTTVTSPAPANNATVYKYASIAQPMYLIQTQAYQGAATGTPLATTVYCYNGNQVSCNTISVNPTLPLSQTDVYTTPAGMSSSSRATRKFDTYGNTTEIDAYDFGAASPTVTTKFLNYGKSWNGSISSPTFSVIGSGVNNAPGQVESFDISGTPIANSFFSYDSDGNNLSAAKWVSGSITTGKYLTTSYLYDTRGSVNKVTDPNGNIATFVTLDCGGYTNSSTIWTVPSVFSLTSTAVRDCNGGVVNSATGFDGQSSSAQYADPYWRKTSSTDALSNVTTYTYTPTTSESIFSFNGGSSVQDVYLENDPVALTTTAQTRRGPGLSWDTVVSAESVWDATGSMSESSITCSTSKGGTCAWEDSETHDALGRPLVTTTGLTGGSTVTYTYSGRDVLSVVGPAPTGEVVKQTRTEYDGLGRVKSVCQLSSATGSKSCGQDTAGTGFPTVYTYNAAGPLSSVARSTSTQTQTHSFTYDIAGRVLTSTYPESGTQQAFYDAAPATPGVACAVPTYNGKLVKTYDANGNTMCYTYDGIGRTTSIVYTGPNDDGNNKYFVYDAATVNGVAMSGTQYRLAEAYTAPTVGGTKVTDEGFSYDALGRVTDVYQSTTHSGGYYHTTSTYFENGALKTISGIPGTATFTYSIDGKGRPYSLIQNPSTAITNSVTYNAWDQPLNVNLGLGDSDVYTYNAQTKNMSGFTFTIGATPKVLDGTLTWNGNYTLRKLVLTDTISTGAQTCNYGTSSVAGYDELGRIVSADCGSVFAQTFSYDGFNNLSKSGSSSWLPGYNQANNRYTLAGTSYDSNGSLLTDTFHTYTWNQDNQLKGVTDASETLTYDALGRLAEKGVSGTFTQILYGPSGRLATMAGQTTSDYLVPMPGGGNYEQGSYFWHPDWLGNVRLVSTRVGRTMLAERAYAPFGETYKELGGHPTNGVSFTGDLQDTLTGLYDTPNRKQSPVQSRWLSVDPSHSGWNGYSYSAQPLNTTDPSGLRGEELVRSQHGRVDPGGPAGQGRLQAQELPRWYDDMLIKAVQVAAKKAADADAAKKAAKAASNGNTAPATANTPMVTHSFSITAYDVKTVSNDKHWGPFNDADGACLVGTCPEPTLGAVTPTWGFGSWGKSLTAAEMGAAEQGGLNLFKFGDSTSTTATGWRNGDSFLNLPNQGSPAANWAQNSSALRSAMSEGNPIFDSYIDASTGQQIPTTGFLNAERNLLENHGWTFNPQTGAYYPPTVP
jgi:RHS repeat-associated protein